MLSTVVENLFKACINLFHLNSALINENVLRGFVAAVHAYI